MNQVIERRRPHVPPNQPLVLVADGHDDTRALYADSLNELGFAIATASDVATGFALAFQTHPDVIVTEVTFPRHDGWDLIQDVKRHARTHDIPVVVVTCDATAHERAIREGCAAFLVKPCLPDRLAIELRAVLSKTPQSATERC